MEPVSTLCGEVRSKDGVDPVDGNGVIDVHDDGWVCLGLGEGGEGMNVVWDSKTRGVVARGNEASRVDGGERHGGRSWGQ